MLPGEDVVFQHEQDHNFQIFSLEEMLFSPVVLEIGWSAERNKRGDYLIVVALMVMMVMMIIVGMCRIRIALSGIPR